MLFYLDDFNLRSLIDEKQDRIKASWYVLNIFVNRMPAIQRGVHFSVLLMLLPGAAQRLLAEACTWGVPLCLTAGCMSAV